MLKEVAKVFKTMFGLINILYFKRCSKGTRKKIIKKNLEGISDLVRLTVTNQGLKRKESNKILKRESK